MHSENAGQKHAETILRSKVSVFSGPFQTKSLLNVVQRSLASDPQQMGTVTGVLRWCCRAGLPSRAGSPTEHAEVKTVEGSWLMVVHGAHIVKPHWNHILFSTSCP